MKKQTLKENGITLIVLVISIIVLIILAGVSIAMIVGENGIITQTQKAKVNLELAEKQEKKDMRELESEMNEVITGIEVEQVTDENPGILEGSGTDTDPYTINSIEDLVFFAYDVTNGNNYEKKTVKLVTSLDFNSSKSYVEPFRSDYGKYGYDGELKTMLTSGEGFKSIGITTTDDRARNFSGTFDGNNNFINNLYINITNLSGTEKRGLFANNYGIISNIQLSNVNMTINVPENQNKQQLGGICGQNNGTIDSCSVSGKISLNCSSGIVAGITPYEGSNSSITRSVNKADITIIGNTSNSGAGGICASLGGIINNCYNEGFIYGKTAEQGSIFIGGIAGYGSGQIKNCYNIGDLNAYSQNVLFIGGIIGNVYDSSYEVSSCYSIGEVEGEGITEIAKGKVIGRNWGSGSVFSIFYNETAGIQGIGKANIPENLGKDSEMKKTNDFMKDEGFLELLNINENTWKIEKNKNKGYPILNWQ